MSDSETNADEDVFCDSGSMSVSCYEIVKKQQDYHIRVSPGVESGEPFDRIYRRLFDAMSSVCYHVCAGREESKNGVRHIHIWTRGLPHYRLKSILREMDFRGNKHFSCKRATGKYLSYGDVWWPVGCIAYVMKEGDYEMTDYIPDKVIEAAQDINADHKENSKKKKMRIMDRLKEEIPVYPEKDMYYRDYEPLIQGFKEVKRDEHILIQDLKNYYIGKILRWYVKEGKSCGPYQTCNYVRSLMMYHHDFTVSHYIKEYYNLMTRFDKPNDF